ncbi:MAG: hypothetical protein HYY62_07910, partial [Deltaproteobacteria bacterium]|nr:hypothetical protein [Deltaproteobacteria bacterium]
MRLPLKILITIGFLIGTSSQNYAFAQQGPQLQLIPNSWVPTFIGEDELLRTLKSIEDSKIQGRRFIVITNEMGLGDNIRLLGPTIAKAVKSGQFEQIHIYGILANVIPSRNHPIQLSTHLPNNENTDLIETLEKFSFNPDTDVVLVETTIAEMIDFPKDVKVQEYEFRVQTDSVPSLGYKISEKLFPSWTIDSQEVKMLFTSLSTRTAQYAHIKEITLDIPGPYDLYNFTSLTHSEKVAGSPDIIFDFIEQGLIRSPHHVLIAPNGLPEEWHPRLVELQTKYPGRIGMLPPIDQLPPYAYGFFIKKTAKFITIDTGAAHLGMMVAPRKMAILFLGQDHWKSRDRFYEQDANCYLLSEFSRANELLAKTIHERRIKHRDVQIINLLNDLKHEFPWLDPIIKAQGYSKDILFSYFDTFIKYNCNWRDILFSFVIENFEFSEIQNLISLTDLFKFYRDTSSRKNRTKILRGLSLDIKNFDSFERLRRLSSDNDGWDDAVRDAFILKIADPTFRKIFVQGMVDQYYSKRCNMFEGAGLHIWNLLLRYDIIDPRRRVYFGLDVYDVLKINSLMLDLEEAMPWPTDEREIQSKKSRIQNLLEEQKKANEFVSHRNSGFILNPAEALSAFGKNYGRSFGTFFVGSEVGHLISDVIISGIDGRFKNIEEAFNKLLDPKNHAEFAEFSLVASGSQSFLDQRLLSLLRPEELPHLKYIAKHGLTMAFAMEVTALSRELLEHPQDWEAILDRHLSLENMIHLTGITTSFLLSRGIVQGTIKVAEGIRYGSKAASVTPPGLAASILQEIGVFALVGLSEHYLLPYLDQAVLSGKIFEQMSVAKDHIKSESFRD